MWQGILFLALVGALACWRALTPLRTRMHNGYSPEKLLQISRYRTFRNF